MKILDVNIQSSGMETFDESEVSSLGCQMDDRVPASCGLPPEVFCGKDFIEAMDGLNQ
jgi:hypothetical protein